MQIADVAQLGDARKRLKEAAELLGCDAVQACRLAAKMSDALRAELAPRGRGQQAEATLISVVVDMVHSPDKTQLILDIQTGDGPPKRVEAITLLTSRQHGYVDPQTADQVRTILTRKSRAELIDEIREQNEQLVEREQLLQVALSNAKAATEAKSIFLASMSHELRTPMNSILGFTKRLLKRLNGQISERDFDALETVDRNARHLLGLINDILDLSKIEAGRMELVPERCSLGTLLKEVSAECEPLLAADKQSLVLQLSDDIPELHADVTKIRQIVTNLVSNAIKYSDNGTIEITARREYETRLGACAVIGVRDHGAGMTPEEREQLFQPFTRLKTEATKKAGGTGLGLTISAQYASMHGGRIDVKSTPGDGSLFSLYLPLDFEARHASPTTPGGNNLRVLLVERDSAFVSAAKSFFGNLQVDVLQETEPDAIDVMLRTQPPDVVCLGPEHAHLRNKLGNAHVMTLGNEPVSQKSLIPTTLSQLQDSIVRDLGKRLAKVLIVEDNPDARTLVGDVFSVTGAELVFASTGEQALALMADDPLPSAVILDLMLPGLSGFDVLAEIRKTPRLASVPIVVLSAMTLTAAQLRRLETMASAILEKGEGAPERAVTTALAAVRGRGDNP